MISRIFSNQVAGVLAKALHTFIAILGKNDIKTRAAKDQAEYLPYVSSSSMSNSFPPAHLTSLAALGASSSWASMPLAGKMILKLVPWPSSE